MFQQTSTTNDAVSGDTLNISLDDISLPSSISSQDQIRNEWDVLSLETKSDWDVVTDAPELHSVFSFESLPFSYKDALLMKPSATTDASMFDNTSIESKQGETPMKKSMVPRNLPENILLEDDEYHDAFFIMDGYKDARGGKSICMFNTNQRHSRYVDPYKTREHRNSRRRARRNLKASRRG